MLKSTDPDARSQKYKNIGNHIETSTFFKKDFGSGSILKNKLSPAPQTHVVAWNRTVRIVLTTRTVTTRSAIIANCANRINRICIM